MNVLRTLCVDFLAFIVYGFIGWAYESSIWAKAEKKRFINRGMLLGPICPIYGLISFMDWEMLHRIESPAVIFIVSAVVCCIFEYIISWSLEKIFHQRWWDYSNYPLNLNGRISVPSGLFFGAAGLFLVKVVHPFTIQSIGGGRLSDRMIFAAAGVSAFVLLLDIIVTAVSLGMKVPPRRISRIYDRISYRTAQPFEYLNHAVIPLDNYAHKKMTQVRTKVNEVKDIVKEKTHSFTKSSTDSE